MFDQEQLSILFNSSWFDLWQNHKKDPKKLDILEGICKMKINVTKNYVSMFLSWTILQKKRPTTASSSFSFLKLRTSSLRTINTFEVEKI